MSEAPAIGTTDNTTLTPKDIDRELLRVKKYHISIDRIVSHEDELGRGGFGVVKRATLLPADSGSGRPITVVVKELKIDAVRVIPLHAAYRLVREMAVWATCQHENILQFIGYHLGENYDPAYLISPYMKNGNVTEYLKKNQIDSGERLRLVRDTLDGLNYLHTRKPVIVHGDLKAANVVVNDCQRAQLCDFGVSRAVHEDRTGFTKSSAFSGSVRWCSPETLEESEGTCASDIWAWGCLVLEIMADKVPFSYLKSDDYVIVAVLRDKKTPELDPMPNLPEGLPDLLRKCWEFESNKRPNAHSCRRMLDTVKLKTDLSSNSTVLSIGETRAVDSKNEVFRSNAEIDSVIAPGYRVSTTQLPPELLGTLEVPMKRLTAGAFADIYQGKWVRPGEPRVIVAIKRVTFTKIIMAQEEFRTMIKRETIIWAIVKHPNILPFYGYQIDRHGILMQISPWCRNGNLATYIRTRPNLSRSEKVRLLHGTACGLTYLHTLITPIVHGDIKPENILIQDNLEVGLCDLGTLKLIDAAGYYNRPTPAVPRGPHITKWPQAPEVIQEEAPTTASDVYNFGGVILLTMSGKAPFEGKSASAVVMAVVSGNIPLRNDHPQLSATDRLWDLYEACSRLEPVGRPSMHTLLSELKDEM